MNLHFACILAGAALTAAAAPRAQPRPALDAAARSRAIDGVTRCLREGYVFPEVAQKLEKALRERSAGGAYDRIADGDAFAAALTEDLRAVSHDRHLRVTYSAEVLPPEAEAFPMQPPPMPEAERRRMARDNFGLSKLDILPGNIGFLQFRLLAPPEVAGDTYIAAMNYLAHTDALIIDLRTCGGAISPDAIPMLCSYFFAQPTHLNDLYWRPDNSTHQYWTWASVPGKRYLDKPIYLLTSRATFSGAEELAYDLKNLRRATIVGETTGGGAHGGGDRRADDHFSIWVPYGRAINPITHTDWEGVGVTPDVAVPAVLALHRAHALALQHCLTATDDDSWKTRLKRVLAQVERDTPRLKKVTFTLHGFPAAHTVSVAGSFNTWSPEATPLARRGEVWSTEVEVVPGPQTYKFIVDGRWILDPANPRTEPDGEFVNSVRQVE